MKTYLIDFTLFTLFILLVVSSKTFSAKAAIYSDFVRSSPVASIGEVGFVEVNQRSKSIWHTVQLTNRYSSPVVIMGPPSFNDNSPVTVRVRNVTGSSFQFQLDEWDYQDGVHGTETISYLVVEEGKHTLQDGRTIQAGVLRLNDNWASVNYGSPFLPLPVVLTQVGSRNGSSAAIVRMRNYSFRGFEVRIDEEEGNDRRHMHEQVFWVAVSAGDMRDGIANEADFRSQFTDQFNTITFRKGYACTPLFFAGMYTTNGGDPATLRYRNLGSTSVEVMVQEEQSANSEMRHAAENIGFLVFNEPGQIPMRTSGRPPNLVAFNDRLWDNNVPIPVCWEESGWATEKEWVKNAVAASWENYADLSFSGWGPCEPYAKGIRIGIADENPHVKNPIGKDMSGVCEAMVLNFSFNDWSPSLKRAREYGVKAIAVHEFGHALGITHEHNRSGCGCDWQDSQGSSGNWEVTECDASSIMNYCAENWSNNGLMSPLDVRGIQILYGQAATLPLQVGSAFVEVRNKGLTRTWFEVKYKGHGQNTQTKSVYLNFNESHKFPIDAGSVIESIEGQYLDIITWKKIFKEGRIIFPRSGYTVCYSVEGPNAKRCDRGQEAPATRL